MDFTLQEKIDFEREEFFSYLMLNSRSALIDKAWEISVKQALYEKIISDFDKLPEKLKEKMLLSDDVVDFIYLKEKDNIEIVGGKLTSLSWTKIINTIFI